MPSRPNTRQESMPRYLRSSPRPWSPTAHREVRVTGSHRSHGEFLGSRSLGSALLGSGSWGRLLGLLGSAWAPGAQFSGVSMGSWGQRAPGVSSRGSWGQFSLGAPGVSSRALGVSSRIGLLGSALGSWGQFSHCSTPGVSSRIVASGVTPGVSSRIVASACYRARTDPERLR